MSASYKVIVPRLALYAARTVSQQTGVTVPEVLGVLLLNYLTSTPPSILGITVQDRLREYRLAYGEDADTEGRG